MSTPSSDPATDAASSTSLERLRDRVNRAVDEIHRLRSLNTQLRQRVSELEAEGPAGATVLALDDEPEALNEKINTFIGAIDRYLDQQSTSEAVSSSQD